MLGFLILPCAWAQDPCTVVVRKRIASYAEAMACYGSFPLSSEIHHATLARLRRVAPLASDLPGAAAFLEKQLDALARATFPSELRFHTALASAFAKIGLRYDTGCFASFRFRLPLELVIHEDAGRPVVRVAGLASRYDRLAAHWRTVGIDPLAYRGVEVVTIEATPALDYLQRFTKSRAISLNQALSRNLRRGGAWRLVAGAFASRRLPPAGDKIRFGLAGGRNLTAPILVEIPPGFHDRASFYKNMCLPAPPQDEPSTRATALAVFGKKAALAISEFKDSPEFEQELAGALSYIGKHGVQELVVDLQDSSGDHICASYHLLGHLFPQHAAFRFPMIFPNHELIQTVIRKCLAAEAPCRTMPIFARGLKCRASFLGEVASPLNASRIKFVTNGICSGACVIFARGLLETGRKGYFVGGTPYLGTSGIPYSLAQLSGDLVSHQLVYFPLPTRADLHFTIGQSFKADGLRLVPLDEVAPQMIRLPVEESYLFSPLPLWSSLLNTSASFHLPYY